MAPTGPAAGFRSLSPYPHKQGRASPVERPVLWVTGLPKPAEPDYRLRAASTFSTTAAPVSPAAQPVKRP